MTCTFFGHRDCYGLDKEVLKREIEGLIANGVDIFYVGHQGGFDSAVYSCLKQLRQHYPHIRVWIVLAYLPTEKQRYEDLSDTMYPEIEGHPRFAIERRNRWMIDHSDYCICYIRQSWGGAWKFARMAKQRGLHIRNLGTLDL